MSDGYEHILAFSDAMAEKGLLFRGELEADGELHRFHIDGDKPGTENGWYKLHIDGKPNGQFGCWKRYGEEKLKWSPRGGTKRPSAVERDAMRDKIEADKARRAEVQAELYREAAGRAKRMWDVAEDASDAHAYLRRKRIQPHGARVGEWVVESPPDKDTGEIRETRIGGALLIPLKHRKDVWSLQAIFPSDRNALKRGKDYLAGGRKRGCYYPMGGRPPEGSEQEFVITFCEGFATGASINEATGRLVVVCFDSGNIEPVVEFFRQQYPDTPFVIAADNDRWTDKNPGVTKARAAAEKHNAWVAAPHFSKLDTKPTDFNDLHIMDGLDAVRSQVEDVIARRESTAIEDCTAIGEIGSAASRQAADGIPSLYRLTETAVEVLTGEEKFEFVCGRLEVTARTRDENSGSWGRQIRFFDPDGREKVFAIPDTLMAGEGLELREQLMAQGLTVSSKRAAKQNLNDYILQCQPKARVRCVNRVGWNQGAFALPGSSFGDADAEAVILQSALVNVSDYRQAGSLDDWKANVARYAAGNTRLAFSISAAFAAPLLEMMGEENGGFHWCGGSSIGKSTALVVAGSVWGGGGDRGYLKSWKATDNGLEAMAAAHCDTLLCLDEMGQVADTVAYSAAYALANGIGKHRADQKGGNRPSATWRILFLSSGEISLRAKLEENGHGKKVAAGQQVRIINLEADAGASLGIFETVHGFGGGDALATHLKSACSRYYGVAAPEFLRGLIGDRAGAIARMTADRDAWLAGNVPAGVDGQVSRAARRFALVAAAGEEAIRNGIVSWANGEAHRASAICFKGWLNERGGTGDAESAAGLAQVRGYFEAHGASRFTEIVTGRGADAAEDGSLENEKTINRAGWRRAVAGDQWEYFVLPVTWNNEVCKGLNHKYVNKMLIDIGILMPGKDTTTQTVWIPGHGKPRVYRVTSKIIERDDEPDVRPPF